MIEQRARELAVIAGRPAQSATAADRRDARRQLTGPGQQTSTLKDRMPWPAPPWESPITSTGHRKRPIQPRDDRNTERLVKQGVDEAERSRALAARRTGR